MTKNIYFSCILFFLFSGSLFAQSNKIDSLIAHMEEETVDSLKIDLLFELTKAYWYRNPTQAKAYCLQALNIAEKRGFQNQQLLALGRIGSIDAVSDPSAAIIVLNKAIKFRADNNLSVVKLGTLYKHLGRSYLTLNNFELAGDYFLQGLEVAKEQKDELLTIDMMSYLTDLYALMGEYDKALETSFETLAYYESKGEEYLYDVGMNKLMIGRFYFEKENIAQARPYILAALDIGIKNKFEYIEGPAYSFLSKIATKKEDFQTALDYAQKALPLAYQSENPLGIIESNLLIAQILLKQNKYEAALSFIDPALEFSKDNLKGKLMCEELLVEVYAHQQDYKKEVVSMRKVLLLTDSLNKQAFQKEVASMEAIYELDKKEKALENQQLLLDKQHLQRNFLFFLSLILLGFGGAIYYAYRQKTKYSEKLNRLNKMTQLQSNELKIANQNLKDFSQTISHDILSQIELIISITGYYALKKISTEQQTAWGEVKGVGKKLKAFALGLITLSKIEAETKPLQEVDLNAVLADIKGTFRQEIEANHAQIEIMELPTILAHETQMVQLFQNLITNAIRYKKVDESPIIEIKVAKQEQDYLFSVTDNGLGIPKAQQEVVFQSFKRISNSKAGSGLGLAICKKIVTYYEGEIWLESEVGKGTTVFFTYPL